MQVANVPSDLPRIGTAHDVAAQLHTSTRTVLRLAARGELPSVRIGKLYRFNLDAIAAMFDDGGSSREG